MPPLAPWTPWCHYDMPGLGDNDVCLCLAFVIVVPPSVLFGVRLNAPEEVLARTVSIVCLETRCTQAHRLRRMSCVCVPLPTYDVCWEAPNVSNICDTWAPESQ